MVALKKYNLNGEEIGEQQVAEHLTNAEVNSQLVKDYIVAIRNNARQWSAKTKDRSEVAHTTKKSNKQKGTGGARHSDLVAPQYRGGGICFGPRPKFDQHTRINQKERIAAIRYLLSQKINDGSVCLIDDTTMDQPKTKTLVNFMKSCDINGRVLFIGEGHYFDTAVFGIEGKISLAQPKHDSFKKSLQNIPKVSFALAKNINGYDLMLNKKIVMTSDALNEISEWLSTQDKRGQ